MRLLVCGGRDFDQPNRLFDALDQIARTQAIRLVIHGGAPGADKAADIYAKVKGLGLAVLACPGGRGTADMVRRAKEAGVQVWYLEDFEEDRHA